MWTSGVTTKASLLGCASGDAVCRWARSREGARSAGGRVSGRRHPSRAGCAGLAARARSATAADEAGELRAGPPRRFRRPGSSAPARRRGDGPEQHDPETRGPAAGCRARAAMDGERHEHERRPAALAMATPTIPAGRAQPPGEGRPGRGRATDRGGTRGARCARGRAPRGRTPGRPCRRPRRW